jgi:hypothetical protein
MLDIHIKKADTIVRSIDLYRNQKEVPEIDACCEVQIKATSIAYPSHITLLPLKEIPRCIFQ